MKNRSPITTHVLDTSRGKAASGIPVLLERRDSETQWTRIALSSTNADGRVENLLAPESKVEAGTYRLTFETEGYFRALGTLNFYPLVILVFKITQPTEHHHVPLLISPFGYSTYRGT
jgi:5-hydroxyisourate hydrolase